jgi:hypothetical protein
LVALSAKIDGLEQNKSLTKHQSKSLAKLNAKRWKFEQKGLPITEILVSIQKALDLVPPLQSSGSSSTCFEVEEVTRIALPGI